MKCKVTRSIRTGEILQVKARNGKRSKLFLSLEKVYNNSESAIKQYSNTYLSKFAQRINPSNDVLLATVLQDESLNRNDFDTISKIRDLDKLHNDMNKWSLYKDRLFNIENDLGGVGNIKMSDPLTNVTRKMLAKPVKEIEVQGEAEMALAYELGFITDEDVANYYGDFDSYYRVQESLPSMDEMKNYAVREHNKAVKEMLGYLLDQNVPVSTAAEIVRLLEKPERENILAGVDMFLGQELTQLLDRNPILKNIEQVDALTQKRKDFIERGQYINNPDTYLGLFDTKEVNKKLDDNFDPKVAVFNTAIKSIDLASKEDVNEYSINEDVVTLDIEEAKNNLNLIVGPNVELRTDFENVLDNMKDSGQM
jgi:hypothetical protein